ncbi:uncharacterized protein LOC114320220 [Camellia sinensis]|uniref:uncharacterized protein LOC114320220 n=1 Tax=Camellia sinensis TaxID=4442 RepID=UPI001035D2FB|nr:uncharacterized protein LOC114320220 [Camellia sinensis]
MDDGDDALILKVNVELGLVAAKSRSPGRSRAVLSATPTFISSALSLAMTGLSSKVIVGAQGASGFFDPEVVVEEDLGFFGCWDSDGWVCVGCSSMDDGMLAKRKMGNGIMLICCYSNVNVAINLQVPFRFDDVVSGGADEFRSVLRKYAVECGFRFKYVKNDSVRITTVCMMRESKGCMWSVHARVLHANGFFYLRKWNKEHIYGVAVRTPKNPRAGSDLVSDVISNWVCDKPLTRPIDVVYDLKKDYGLEVSYRVAWLGVEKARGEMFGAHSISFDQLRWYSSVVVENNPGSYVNIDCDEHNNHFIRYFISFKACIDGFNHCRPLLFLDGTFLKGKFKGHLLAATAKDGNQGLFPIAIAIVDSENTANWAWFLGHLANVVNSHRTFTFVSDRHAGLLESIPITFPTALHAFCLQHLQRNLQHKLRYVNTSYRAGMLTKFRACAYAPTVASFTQCAEEFTKCGRKVVPAFLKDLPLQFWANAYFRGSRYGEMSSNAVESFNSWIRETRHLPITQLVDSIRVKIMHQMAKRKIKAQAWPGVICPKMEARLVKAYNKGRAWLVSQSTDTVFEVHSFPSVMVNVDKRTCSCFKWQINGFPCSHAVVAIRNSELDLYDLVAEFYYGNAYRNSYQHNIQPIPTVEKPAFNPDDFVIHPPSVKRPPSRPKQKKNSFPR